MYTPAGSDSPDGHDIMSFFKLVVCFELLLSRY